MIETKAVFTTPEAQKYVGGRPMFEKLQQAYPSLMEPFEVGKPTGTKSDGTAKRGKTKYLKDTIDRALKAAQMDRRFVDQ